MEDFGKINKKKEKFRDDSSLFVSAPGFDLSSGASVSRRSTVLPAKKKNKLTHSATLVTINDQKSEK
jgi:hypothetical protein